MQSVSWGFIGCGDVTEVKSGPAFQKTDNSQVVAVMCRDPAKAKGYAKRHHIARWYSDSAQLINDSEVNAIYVATPPAAHADLAMQALAAGKPVYLEKPMGISYEECQLINSAVVKFKVPLFVAYYRRCLPAFLKVKQVIDSGIIGEIRLVNLRLYHALKSEDYKQENLPWRLKPQISGGGYFFDLSCHQLDLLDYLLGPITTAQGHTANQARLYPVEDIVTSQFKFENGALGTGIWCFSVANFNTTDSIEIIGAKGKVVFATFENNPVQLITQKGQETFTFENPAHIQQPLIQTVVNELLGKGKCPSNGISAARTNKVLDQILHII